MAYLIKVSIVLLVIAGAFAIIAKLFIVLYDILFEVKFIKEKTMSVDEEVAKIKVKLVTLQETIHAINLKLDDVKDKINAIKAGTVISQAQLDDLSGSIDTAQAESTAVLDEAGVLAEPETPTP